MPTLTKPTWAALLLLIVATVTGGAAADDAGLFHYTGQPTPRPRTVRGDWREIALAGRAFAIQASDQLAGGPALGVELLTKRLASVGVEAATRTSAEASGVRLVLGLLGDPQIRALDEEHKLGLGGLVLPTQGYAIRVVSGDGPAPTILAAGVDDLGLFYSLATLYQQVGTADNAPILRVADMDDAPVWRQRYASDYGAPTREHLVRFALAKVNGFAIQHRYDWRKFGPDYKNYGEVFANIKSFKEQTGLMSFMLLLNLYAERPRQHPIFDSTNEQDIEALLTRLRFAADHGIDHIMICVDDWTPMVSGVHLAPNETERQRFGANAGRTHGYLMRRVYDALRPAYPNLELSICPAPYSVNHVKQFDTAGESQYLRDLAAALPSDVAVVWTGPVVSSLEVKREDFLTYSSYVMNEQPLMLWDNTPAVAANNRDMPQAIVKFYDGFEADSQGRIFMNGFAFSKPWMAVCALSSNDYLWNPHGFDPAASHRNVTEQVYGRGAYGLVQTYLDAEGRVARAGKDRGPAQAALAEAEAAAQRMKDAGLPTRDFGTTLARHRARIQADPPRVAVARVSEAPVIDGELGDEAWSRAAELTAFEAMQAGATPARTTGRIAYDDRALYLSFEAHHDAPLAPPIGADYRDAPVYALADNLQIFLRATASGGSQVQLAFDHEGNLFDMANNDKEWNADWTVVVKKGDSVWRAEVSIPFEALMPPFDARPESGDVWSGNFCRSRPAQGENSSWSATHGARFTDTAFFGELVFQ